MGSINKEFKVCKIDEIPQGEAKCFTIDDKEIGVFNIKGKLYAIDNLCIHAGAALHECPIDEDTCQVTCGWHAWSFDLATGKCVTHPRQDVFCNNYQVKVVCNDVYVHIPQDIDK